MRRLCARWIPKMLTEEQKARRVSSCVSFLTRVEREGDTFLDRIVTVDETWISLYDPETKQQSSMWKGPGSHPQRSSRWPDLRRNGCSSSFTTNVASYCAITVPEGQTVNSQYYSKVRIYLLCLGSARSLDLFVLISDRDQFSILVLQVSNVTSYGQ